MPVTYGLFVSDGLTVRCIHPPALPPEIRDAVDRFILDQVVEGVTAAATERSEIVKPVLAAVTSSTGDPDERPFEGLSYRPKADRIAEAKSKGFVGIMCLKCSSFNTKHNGHCLVCDDCGETTGCS